MDVTMILTCVTMIRWADVPDSDWGDFRCRRAVDISSYLCPEALDCPGCDQCCGSPERGQDRELHLGRMLGDTSYICESVIRGGCSATLPISVSQYVPLELNHADKFLTKQCCADKFIWSSNSCLIASRRVPVLSNWQPPMHQVITNQSTWWPLWQNYTCLNDWFREILSNFLSSVNISSISF